MKKHKKILIVALIFVAFNIITLVYSSTLTGHGSGMAMGIFLGIFDVIVLAIAFVLAIYKIIKIGYLKTAIGIAIIVLAPILYYLKQEFYPEQVGAKELKSLLKQANLTLNDDFEIGRLFNDYGRYCEFSVAISENDHQQLIDQIKKIPEVQEDSERYIIEKPKGYQIIVDKYAKTWLGVYSCPEIPNVNYGYQDKWMEYIHNDSKAPFFKPKLNKSQLNDEGFISTKEDSTDAIKKSWDFILINGSQAGIYSYEIGIGNIEKGSIYLKAFETTTNHPLSVESLKRQSLIEVKNKSTKLKKTESSFTIYEGGQFIEYLARFELWYKADNSKQEIKVAEKVYEIEGWEQ